MAEEKNELNKAGDPGSTPGSAEGDRETVEQDLQEKGLDGGSESKGGQSDSDKS